MRNSSGSPEPAGNQTTLKIDVTDLQILEILRENGRTPNNEIAARLSISEGTVRNRIKKMMDGGFLSVRGLTNPDLREDKQIIFILVKISPHKDWDMVARRIAGFPGVVSVCMLTGRFDLLIETYIEPRNLIHMLSDRLSGIESIVSTESLICVRSYNKWI